MRDSKIKSTISIDADLQLETPRGTVSVENRDLNILVVEISKAAAFRDILRVQSAFEKLIHALGVPANLLAIRVVVDGRYVGRYERGQFRDRKTLFLTAQYLLAKLGF